MKKLFSIFICFAMLIGTCGISLAEEVNHDVFLNLKDKDVINVMKNTVMVYPGAEKAYAYGKGIELDSFLDEYEVKKDGEKVLVPAGFLKEIFPEAKVGDNEESDIYEFSKENNLKASSVDGIVYVYSEDYSLPKTINSNMRKFFGIYAVPDGKGNGSKESPCGGLLVAKETVQSLKNSVGLPDGGISVYLREGKYTITNTLNFTAKDSGMEGSPIRYEAYRDEKVSFNGGVSIKGSEFKKVTDSDALKKISNAKNIVSYDLSAELSAFNDSFKTMDPDLFSLSYKGEALTVARWPDNDWARTGEILENPKDFRNFGFRFVVGDTRVRKWKNEKLPKIMGYFGFDWAGERRTITEVDEDLLAIKTDKGAEYGLAQNKRYYVYNMLCELDAPGEFYFDISSNIIYFYPVEGDPKNQEFLNNELQFALTSANLVTLNDADYLNFEKITFENALGLALEVDKDCEHVEILGSVFTNLNAGVNLSGFNNVVRSCDFYNISARPLTAEGGDRATLTPSGNLITNNKFWNFNTISRTNTAAINQCGTGDTISHNEFVGGPHTTVAFGGNDNVIEYNEFYDTLQDGADDAGTIYGGRNISVQGNTVRRNFFHDLSSIGAVYLDDTLSGHTVTENVFRDTGTIAFVHGGVYNNVCDNLSFTTNGGEPGGIGSSHATIDWNVDGVTLLQHNFNTYYLTTIDWKNEPWTKYNDVFKFVNSGNTENPFPMYNCVYTGNIFVGTDMEDKITVPVESVPVVTEENNTYISKEDAKNYVIPEMYQEVIDTAGIYIDEYRKELSSVKTFDLLRPYNKSVDVEASAVRFEWSGAEGAYKYQFTLATDKDFKNIISNKLVRGTAVELEKLNYHNTRYYWKVKAIANNTNSMQGERVMMSSQPYYSFTTKEFEVVSRAKLLEQITICEGNISAVTEGEEPGQHKPGTADKMKELVAYYKAQAEKPNITNKEVATFAENLKNEFEELTYNRNPEYYDFKTAVASGSNWDFTPNQTIFSKDKISYIYQTSQTLASAKKLSPHINYKFMLKWDGYDGGWMGIGVRAQASSSAVPWSGNPMYFMILKKDTVEFQKWGSGENVNTSYPNEYTKNDEWAEVEITINDREDGTSLFTWKIDGKTVVEYEDKDMPIRTPGYLYLFQGTANAMMEITPVTEENAGEGVEQ